jgi:hypothetical protein
MYKHTVNNKSKYVYMAHVLKIIQPSVITFNTGINSLVLVLLVRWSEYQFVLFWEFMLMRQLL